MRSFALLGSSVFVALSIASFGCKTADAAATPRAAPSPAPAVAANAANPLPEASAGSARAQPPENPVYFEFDGALLDAAAQSELQAIAAYMVAEPRARVRISGHADERGTSEYNLALGDARARAARDYLVKMGVAADRIRFETRGEEQPVIDAHDEHAWAKNRRDEIVFESAR
jgi:peptidoglycan-associated lipoprotein